MVESRHQGQPLGEFVHRGAARAYAPCIDGSHHDSPAPVPPSVDAPSEEPFEQELLDRLGAALEAALEPSPGHDDDPDAPDGPDDFVAEPPTESVDELGPDRDLRQAPLWAPASPVLKELHQEMGMLREQLDTAFEEVVDRIKRVEMRLGAIRLNTEAQVEGMHAQEQRSASIIELLLGLTSALEASLAPPDDGERPPSLGVPLDLRPVDERLTQVGSALSEQLIDSRMRLEEGLDQIRDQLEAFRATPIPVNTKALEDAADRGSLRNAADIANLRRNIEALAESVRIQDRGLSELRVTLDWIKERLLLR